MRSDCATETGLRRSSEANQGHIIDSCVVRRRVVYGRIIPRITEQYQVTLQQFEYPVHVAGLLVFRGSSGLVSNGAVNPEAPQSSALAKPREAERR